MLETPQVLRGLLPSCWSQQFEIMLGHMAHVKTWTQSEVYGSIEKKGCAVALKE